MSLEPGLLCTSAKSLPVPFLCTSGLVMQLCVICPPLAQVSPRCQSSSSIFTRPVTVVAATCFPGLPDRTSSPLGFLFDVPTPIADRGFIFLVSGHSVLGGNGRYLGTGGKVWRYSLVWFSMGNSVSATSPVVSELFVHRGFRGGPRKQSPAQH